MKKEHWIYKKLSEVSVIYNGNSINEEDKKKKFLNQENGIPYIATKDVGFDSIIDYHNGVKIPLRDKEEFKTAPKGTVLVCAEGGSAGRKIGFTSQEICFGNKLFAVVPNDSYLLGKFSFYYCLSEDFQAQFKNLLAGLIGGVSLNKFRDISIPIPPLPEQQRIVSLLDETFAGLAQVHANAERNLVNAREVFEAISKETFESSKAGWNKHTLGDKDIIEIIDSDRGVNYPKKSDFHEDGYCLFLNTKNVRPDGFDFTNTMFITEKKDKTLGKGKLSRNDVVMTTRGTIGNLGVYTKDVPFENIRTNSGMLIFRPNTKRLLPEFLFEVLRSGTIKEQIAKNVSGAAQPQLPIKTLVNFTFHIPESLEEQRAIVERLDALAAETSRLEAVYQSKLEAVEELKKSVLGKAFEGEL